MGEVDIRDVGAEGATAPESLRQKDRDCFEALESGCSKKATPTEDVNPLGRVTLSGSETEGAFHRTSALLRAVRANPIVGGTT